MSGDIKAEQVNRESIYVLENFDTPPFKLLARKCRLVGPGVVLAHLQRGLVRSSETLDKPWGGGGGGERDRLGESGH